MKLTSILLTTAALVAATLTSAKAAEVELWRLDCGSVEVKTLGMFSDTFQYQGESRTLADGCYVIRHDSDYMLWDTGLPAGLIGAKADESAALIPSLTVDIPTQLATIGLKPDQIGRVGISHNHFDHVGQAASFPGATLLIGAADLEGFKAKPPAFAVDPAFIAPWLTGGSKVEPVSGDHDVFGDGSVTMLAMPGHTKGEMALLVKLEKTGPVLLSGDVVHFNEQIASKGVPSFNADRAETLASMERLTAIAENLKATLVIQHDETHVARLPAFPESAK
ncbi:N-acyl homoserine lactonase family protein [Pararhizobium sp.]|uniref:N-acyl homoserine lactonase family protein n=1 Tax=Pararhizobium sp. TaxID=1977563 RepID=UPI002727E2C1|nr:N-acyl homoserine lactonase family protein [Pararhizobium sp.]MDO9417228.1 N-acyl homoserine lactonase family protein [Pararhizobium sp.]